MIGVILLIGIVKKNAILMIDFALEVQREGKHEGGRGNLPVVPAAFPPDHDDHDGGPFGRFASSDRDWNWS